MVILHCRQAIIQAIHMLEYSYAEAGMSMYHLPVIRGKRLALGEYMVGNANFTDIVQ